MTVPSTAIQVETGHQDMIVSCPAPRPRVDTTHLSVLVPKHDAQLDYYGRRLATASSDRTIRLFDVESPANGAGDDSYRLADQLVGHDGPIHALAWAHPSFGQILASCSFDGKVFIWKENDGPHKGWNKVKEHLLHTASGMISLAVSLL